jgi:predicted small secreted protein
MIKRSSVIIIVIVFAAMLMSCNTVHGLGKDIDHLGQAMKKSSSKQ